MALPSFDLDQWQSWWEFNKDPYLQLKKAIHSGTTVTGSDDFIVGRGLKEEATSTLAPGKQDRQRIIAALKKSLDTETNRDIISSCLIGLAKIGGDVSILPLLRKFLPDNDQEKRETAALSMGIAAFAEAVPDLIALAKDTPEGRKLVKRSDVDFRTRSFACYGLGLIAYRTKDHELKRKVFEVMKKLTDEGAKKRLHRDLIVSPIQAMRLLGPDIGTEAGRKLRDDAVEFLTAYMNKSDKQVYGQVRSHAYIAVARLIGRGGDTNGVIKQKMIADINNRKQKLWIHQASVLGLGQIAVPDDVEVSEALQTYMKRGKDLQAKNFCGVALGQIGGSANRIFLVNSMRRAKKLLKPWIALGLAINDYNIRKKDKNSEGDIAAMQTIKREFDKTKNPLYAAGMAIALGVMKDKESGKVILDRLEKIKNNEEPAGYLCVALGLMNYQDAKDQINALVERSTRREKLLTQSAIALGLLGDKEISLKLIQRMQDTGNVVAVHSALAQALGFIGDKRSIAPLIKMLDDKSHRDLSRAFAAVALGLVGDKEDLPWNSKIAVDNNYRANVETLTGNGTGILDIL